MRLPEFLKLSPVATGDPVARMFRMPLSFRRIIKHPVIPGQGTVARYNTITVRILLRFKLAVLLVILLCLQASASIFAQKVTLAEKNVPLVKIFREVRKQTGYMFLYNNELLKQFGPVSISVKDASINEVLDLSLEGLPLSYTITNKTIILKPAVTKKQEEAVRVQPPVEIKGRLLDDKTGEPIVGATVVLKGSSMGTVTDKDGAFKLTANTGDYIEVRSMGYETKLVLVNDKADIVVRLAITTQSMKDVVVTGVFSRPKQNFTGAAASFTAEDLSKVTNSNVLAALRSLDPSFQMPENINLGSNPNALPEVVLRGGNSLVDLSQVNNQNPFGYANSPNVPLFILDGFETSLQRINDLDMNRIAKVDILKDAAATAIYGSRAANGVIVIETLRPQSGKLRVTYNANMVVETPDLSGYNLLNAREKLDLESKAGGYTNSFNYRQEELNFFYNARLAEIERGVNTDWLAKPLRTGIGQKHNIYVEGGGNGALYGMSGTFDKVAGVMKESDRRNIMANTYLSYRVKNFQFRNDLTLNYNRANNSPYGSFTQYTRLNPYWTPYDADGNMKVYLEDVRNLSGQRLSNFDRYDNLDGQNAGRAVNPLYNAGLNVVDRSTYQNLINNFFVQWQATEWLRFSGRIAYTQQSDESDRFLPAQHTSFVSKPTFEKGTYTKGYGKRSNLEGMLTADVNKSFDKHLFFGTVGLNFLETKFNTESFMVEGFPNPRLDQLTLGNRFPEGSKPVGTEGISRLAGYLANVSYAYDNRYLLDMSYRLDGSSQFGAQRRFAPFWSLGAGWNIHKEHFFRGMDFIDRMKLRYSYGFTGSQNFPSYLGITTSQYYTNEEYRGVIGTQLMGYGNPALAWQKTLKKNFGADITLFKRLDIVANYFVEKTEGSIATISTPPSVGFNFYNENMGDVESRGWELNTRYTILSRPATRDVWSVFVNAFAVKSKIKRVSNTLAQLNKSADTSLSTRPIIRYAEGQSTNAIWAVRSLGIDPSTGQEIFVTRDGQLTNNYSPLDQAIVGDYRPAVEGTFGTNVEIRGIGLNAYFRFRFGGQAYNQTLIERVENVSVAYYNVDRRVAEERWMKPGDHTFFKGLAGYNGVVTDPTYATSRFVQDDNMITCESLSVYYRFPDALNKKLKVQNTKITLFTSDLFRVSSIKRERGLDYPFSQTYTIQLQTSF